MDNVGTILLIDGNPAHAQVFRDRLLIANGGRFQGEWVRSLAGVFDRLAKNDIRAFQIIRQSDSQGLAAFDKIIQAAPGTPTLLLGSIADEAIVTEALQRGAKDYSRANLSMAYFRQKTSTPELMANHGGIVQCPRLNSRSS